MSVQQTLVIVKPDGIAKGLVGQILRAVEFNNLVVAESRRLRLGRDWVEDLYGFERDKSYFKEVVEWVSSSDVLLLRIQGEQAVDKVKWQIVGRYPNGIRGHYSENWIKNVAHAPDSVQSATQELQLALSLFERMNLMDEIRLSGKMIFALTGMSECGKSTVGKYFDEKGISRLKIVRLFEAVRDKLEPREELYEFLKKQEERDPYALWDAFAEELLLTMEKSGKSMVSIESLYGGGLGPYLMQKFKEHFCIIFIDTPIERRVLFQMQRENLGTVEAASIYLSPRDEVKERSGIPALKDMAGEVLSNSGTLDELYQAIDVIIKKHLQ
ncbi:hypothetical protein HYW73_03860 [Candidatus Nomurabacteria bacterium]|nr:hypothetical protein [Candidatus Nomurabacteria bacterium]